VTDAAISVSGPMAIPSGEPRPRTALEVLDAAFALYRRGFARVTSRLLLLGSPAIVVSVLEPALGLYLGAVTSLALKALAIAEGAHMLEGRERGTGRAIATALADWIALLVLTFLVAVATGVVLLPLMLLVVLGITMGGPTLGGILGVPAALAAIWLVVRLYLWDAVWVTERTLSAPLRSFRLTKGAFWKILGVAILVALITMGPSLILQIANGAIAGGGAELSPALAIGSMLTNVLLIPFSSYVTVLLLFDRLAVREGADLAPTPVAAV
jgi:hypothetical protein